MPFDTNQFRLFAAILFGSIALLAGVWFFVLRTEYVPVYENIRESDASMIVAELDNAGIAYRLANNGHDILVSKGQAAEARVAVAGADIPMGGTTGFELFNENDLGLTEFAQKINLQRAIQGELARTIMMMEGVEFARVHLAIPERTLFRAEQKSPTAAVTVEMRPSFELTAASIGGIRQLVASSVPGLSIEDVAVLDDGGGLVSASFVPALAPSVAQPSERAAVENLLTIRAREAISNVLPQQPFDLQVSAFEQIADEIEEPTSEDGVVESEAAAPTERAARPLGLDNRSLRILIRTPQTLGPEERSAITNALVAAVQLSTENGDVLDFSTGALASATPTPIAPSVAPSSSAPEALPAAATSASGSWAGNLGGSWWLSSWVLIPLVLAGIALLAMRPRRQLSTSESESFAEMLRNASLEIESK